MRKKATCVILFICIGASIFGAEFKYDKPFGWVSPEIMAQGGSYTAVAQGFQSLMTNPAGFAYTVNKKKIVTKNNLGDSVTTIQGTDMVTLQEEGDVVKKVQYRERGEVTILGITPWIVGNIFETMNNASSFSSTTKLIPFIIEQVQKQNTGLGAQFGGGYVGHGFGFGIIGTLEGIVPKVTTTIMSIGGSATGTLAFVGGYSHKFDLGPVNLAIGGNIRPMWKIKLTGLNFNTLYSVVKNEPFAFDQYDWLSGWGIGFDLGAIAKWNILTFGLSLRDIGHTRYQYKVANISSGSISPFSGTEYSGLPYISPMTLRLGVGVKPDFGRANKIIAFKAHAEVAIPLIDASIVENFKAKSFWAKLNIGAEAKLIDIFSFRAGLSGGYPTVGLGFDLFIAEINFALYGQETGVRAGDHAQMGASLDLIFRF